MALSSIAVELRVRTSCYLLVVGYLGAHVLRNIDFGLFGWYLELQYLY